MELSLVTDIPAIMSAAMVRATIREIEHPGTGKTQTRRTAWKASTKPVAVKATKDGHVEIYKPRPSPWQKVKPGDRLYVRETWSAEHAWHWAKPRDIAESLIWYWADGNAEEGDWTKPWPSIHLPRKFSRLTLVVTATKIERLKAISKPDAVAEGLIKLPATGRYVIAKGEQYFGGAEFDPRLVYARLWDTLHGAGAWAANPEIVAISFIPHLANIDQMPKEQAA
jgi:hypothetical protein